MKEPGCFHAGIDPQMDRDTPRHGAASCRRYCKVWLISACAYFVSGKKPCTYYMLLHVCAYYAYICKTHVRRIQGPAQPKHYRAAMRAFLPTSVLY